MARARRDARPDNVQARSLKIVNTTDTIAAIATGTGGAINIGRISGPGALAVANRVWSGRRPLGADPEDNRRLLFGHTTGGDTALAVFMPGPASYTGDDVVEIQCHGGNMAAAALLEALVAAGARTAEPGEFTFRAFVNGKIDLMQAEAVAEMISGRSREAFQQAARRLDGAGGREIKKVAGRLTELLAETESRLDFPDDEEGFEFTPPESLAAEIGGTAETLRRMADSFEHGRVWREGVRVVLAGKPNSGKSSLLNRLLNCDRAIVAAEAGTTRDTIEENCLLGGVPVVLTDTAGMRETDDPAEAAGVKRSRDAALAAGFVFWVIDAAGGGGAAAVPELPEAFRGEVWRIWNKCDLLTPEEAAALPADGVKLSALTGDGMALLGDRFASRIRELSGFEADGQQFAVNARQAAGLRRAAGFLEESPAPLASGKWECAAFLLREAVSALREVTGEKVGADILDMIFSRFCIGK